MIRHENVVWRSGGLLMSLAIQSLAVPMVEPAFRALLVPAVGLSPLLTSGLLSAPLAAICVTAVAVTADEEQRAAIGSPTEPLTLRDLASIGHRGCKRDRQPALGVAR